MNYLDLLEKSLQNESYIVGMHKGKYIAYDFMEHTYALTDDIRFAKHFEDKEDVKLVNEKAHAFLISNYIIIEEV